MNIFGKKTPAQKPASASKAKATEPDDSQLNELFNNFTDEEEDTEVMTMEGIAKMCEQLDLDPTSDVRVLVLCWRLNATAKPGQVTRSEFVAGMKSMRVSTMAELKGRVPSFDTGFLEKSEFREFYRFCFTFSREGTHKTIEKELAVALLQMVLDTTRAPHLDYFLDFLNQNTQHTRITMDQWDSFLQFNHIVGIDVSNMEDDGAWPLLLDEYVEWRNAQAASK